MTLTTLPATLADFLMPYFVSSASLTAHPVADRPRPGEEYSLPDGMAEDESKTECTGIESQVISVFVTVEPIGWGIAFFPH